MAMKIITLSRLFFSDWIPVFIALIVVDVFTAKKYANIYLAPRKIRAGMINRIRIVSLTIL
jgi:hypothetical protein